MNQANQNFWNACIKSLEGSLGKKIIQRWFSDVSVDIKGTELRLCISDKEVLKKIKQEYLQNIKKTVVLLSPKIQSVSLFLRKSNKTQRKEIINCSTKKSSVDNDTDRSVKIEVNKIISKTSISSINNIMAQQTFDTFVVGKSNKIAFEIMSMIGKGEFDDFSQTIVYGKYGLGKTHLLRSVVNALNINKPDLKVVLVHSERFLVDMVNAINENKVASFRNKYRNCDVLLIDDCHFFANKKRAQQELLEALDHLRNKNNPVILSLKDHPNNIPDLNERLVSFFGWGIITTLKSPDMETRKLIIKKKVSSLKQMHFPEEVVHYIAKHCNSNVREIEGAIKRLHTHSLISKIPITLDLTKKSLSELVSSKKRKLNPSLIKVIVSNHFNINPELLDSDSRSQSVVIPRQIAIHLIRKHTKLSLPEIGRLFHNRGHATVIYSCKKIDQLLLKKEEINSEYCIIEEKILSD